METPGFLLPEPRVRLHPPVSSAVTLDQAGPTAVHPLSERDGGSRVQAQVLFPGQRAGRVLVGQEDVSELCERIHSLRTAYFS